ncbi:MAG: hypothetical protein H0W09_06870 [Solirubrobacterales bacterium]|nr:hypothetical protein [Solirubrobacterales bacterium]
MPIYEFECGECSARFESLVVAGTASAGCPECGATEAPRVYSAQAPTPRIAKSRGDAKRQERKNAALHSRTKANFKASRRRARERKRGGDG